MPSPGAFRLRTLTPRLFASVYGDDGIHMVTMVEPIDQKESPMPKPFVSVVITLDNDGLSSPGQASIAWGYSRDGETPMTVGGQVEIDGVTVVRLPTEAEIEWAEGAITSLAATLVTRRRAQQAAEQAAKHALDTPAIPER